MYIIYFINTKDIILIDVLYNILTFSLLNHFYANILSI